MTKKLEQRKKRKEKKMGKKRKDGRGITYFMLMEKGIGKGCFLSLGGEEGYVINALLFLDQLLKFQN